MQLILVRHGNTFEKGQVALQVGKKTDLSLTEFGKTQIKQLLLSLLKRKITPRAIFSSKLKRQAQSANILAAPFQLKVQYTLALMEIDYGKWEGLSAEEISQKWPQEYRAWIKASKWPSKIFCTSLKRFQNSFSEWLLDLQTSFQKGDTVIAVTSSGRLRFFKNEKVKTGNFCEIDLNSKKHVILSWNQSPLNFR